ncbi:MAG: NAD(P)-dependent oxidoreductase [Clostridia bacterium]|nr:NAD(P)-dependent oxidoreductase [Clostridia bacterium]
MKIAITGGSGHMGQAFLEELNASFDTADSITVLCHRDRISKRSYPNIAHKLHFVFGDISNAEVCRKLIEDCDVVFHICALIPPASDSHPQAAISCNERGTKLLIKAMEGAKKQPALVDVSTVALYGNRTGSHSYGRVGDPLLPSPFDIYAITKLRAEYAVLQSKVEKWVVLRQTALFHPDFLSDNLHDGLMFHTCFDAPLEWVTAKDSGRLLLHLLQGMKSGELAEDFWKKVYNIGGGSGMRMYGYQTYEQGLNIIGGGVRDFFKPHYNATRNFHGMWFSDSDDLNSILNFRTQSAEDYWQEFYRQHPLYRCGRALPKGLIGLFAIKRLLNTPNSPYYWAKNGDVARLTAYFGGRKAYDALQKRGWEDFPLPENIPDFVPMKREERILAYGYDIEKDDALITADDIKTVAEAHGGKCLTVERFCGDMYENLLWRTAGGREFWATAFTVLRAGHWYNAAYEQNLWEFDALAKTDSILARIWYDSHDRGENNLYFFDENFKAHIKTSD